MRIKLSEAGRPQTSLVFSPKYAVVVIEDCKPSIIVALFNHPDDAFQAKRAMEDDNRDATLSFRVMDVD